MKVLTLIILISSSFIYAQSDFNSLLKDVQSLEVPYKSEYNSNVHNQKKVLTQKDSIFLLSELLSTQPEVINTIVSSPFGQLDCKDGQECLDLKNLKEIALIGAIKVDSNNYLLHVILTPSGPYAMPIGILISMNKLGELNDWFFSDCAATGGNPNGDMTRDFKIDNDFRITITEASWGRNNINYSLEVIYKLFRYENSEENKSNDYDNSLENKMEYFDLKEGKFELIKLFLNI